MNDIENKKQPENPIQAIVLIMRDGRVLNVEVSSVKEITMEMVGGKTTISVKFDVPSFEIRKSTSGALGLLGDD